MHRGHEHSHFIYEISIMWANYSHLHIICICMTVQVQTGLFWHKSTLHGSISLQYCSPQMNTNKTSVLSQNELGAGWFISPLIQCTANNDEAVAWSYLTKHVGLGIIAGRNNERRHLFICSIVKIQWLWGATSKKHFCNEIHKVILTLVDISIWVIAGNFIWHSQT